MTDGLHDKLDRCDRQEDVRIVSWSLGVPSLRLLAGGSLPASQLSRHLQRPVVNLCLPFFRLIPPSTCGRAAFMCWGRRLGTWGSGFVCWRLEFWGCDMVNVTGWKYTVCIAQLGPWRSRTFLLSTMETFLTFSTQFVLRKFWNSTQCYLALTFDASILPLIFVALVQSCN